MRNRRLFFAVYGCSGCAALVYEVVWTRVLTLQMGHTVAAVSTVLAAFMGGLALGAFFGGRAAVRMTPRHACVVYAALEIAVAASAIALPLLLAAARPLLAVA
jgi:spermidine synthase